MKKLLGGLVVTALAIALGASAAGAAGGTYDPDTGVVTVTNTGGAGASYEIEHSMVDAANGDVLSFEWRSSDVVCGGGVPRVFIQGGAYNTFDHDPAGEGACGTDDDGDGCVTGTVTGIVDGDAGHIGLVNDNPADLGTIEFRDVTLDGVSLLPPMTPDPEPTAKDECKDGGWREAGWRNQGECVSHFARMAA
jgi:hypothetical protein